MTTGVYDASMADDFTGVPREDWYDTQRTARLARSLAYLAFALVLLLILTLIDKGVLTSFADLFRDHAHG